MQLHKVAGLSRKSIIESSDAEAQPLIAVERETTKSQNQAPMIVCRLTAWS